MAFSDVKKFVASWRKELAVPAVLVGLASAVLFLLWQLGQITLVGQVTLGRIITGLLVLAGLYWTSRRVLAAEENVRVAQEGQITERFTRAIEQLGQEGNDKMAIRLGGIYALERIAKDSEKDHGPIMEVLTAYVREKAPRQEDLNPLALGAKNLPTDIQAILTVISRRETTGKKRGKDRLNLTKTELGGAILPNADLTQIDLIQANLSWADLKGADMRGANLEGAVLSEADLSKAKNLTAEQVRSAYRWCNARLPDYLQYLLPEPPA